jgi:hypothetical protein
MSQVSQARCSVLDFVGILVWLNCSHPLPFHCSLCPSQVWQDDHKRNLRDPAYLCLWEPIPPPGFVAAGMVATTGGGSLPPNDLVRGWSCCCGKESWTCMGGSDCGHPVMWGEGACHWVV